MTLSPRITIGGIEVAALGTEADSARSRAEREAANGAVPLIAHAHSRSPVTVAGVPGMPATCPIPPGPWRLAGTLAIAALVIAILVAISIRSRPR